MVAVVARQVVVTEVDELRVEVDAEAVLRVARERRERLAGAAPDLDQQNVRGAAALLADVADELRRVFEQLKEERARGEHRRAPLGHRELGPLGAVAAARCHHALGRAEDAHLPGDSRAEMCPRCDRGTAETEPRREMNE